VGDLVTVNIVETSKATKKAATKTGRDSSINAGINNLLGYEAKMGDYFHLPSAFNNNIMFKASMGNAFDGSGSTSRDESMTAAITARVTETLPNGNLHIKGTREIKVNNEVQFITLSGFIRPNDISPDNTILSSYVADAKIEYTGQGPVSDKQRPGWLGRALDFLWPF
jgi:flagellar L-ring protein precursor FlgH